jgi:hypothetical protein
MGISGEGATLGLKFVETLEQRCTEVGLDLVIPSRHAGTAGTTTVQGMAFLDRWRLDLTGKLGSRCATPVRSGVNSGV